jgi:DNA-binding response OmpR family regulator
VAGGADGTGRRLEGTARVLLVTDQPVLAKLISLTLNHGTFAVRLAATVAEALDRLARGDPHLVILDMDIEATGSSRVMSDRVMDEIGHEGSRAARVPVIALTRRGDLQTKLAAFDRGVDDIITVPFSPEELLARALAVVRRAYREAIAFAPIVRIGDLEIDIYRRRVRAGADDLHLTPLEQNLLYLLAANAGRLLTRNEIMDYLWGADYVADSNVVDRHIRNLRTKLRDDWRHPRYVATVSGRGYRFLQGASEDDPAEPAGGEAAGAPDGDHEDPS